MSTVVLGADVLYNLETSSGGSLVLNSLGCEVLVSSIVMVKHGLDLSTRSSDRLIPGLEGSGLPTLKVVEMSQEALVIFLEFVRAPYLESIDDSSASAIATAVVCGNTCLAVDDLKVRRLCSERFPEIRLLSTVDLLRKALCFSGGIADDLRVCLKSMIEVSRMPILGKDREWVECFLLEGGYVAEAGIRVIRD